MSSPSASPAPSLYRQVRSMTDQLRALQDQLATDPGNPDIFHAFQILCWEHGNWREALQVAREQASLSTLTPDYKDLAKSLKELADSLDPGPEKAQALLALGDLYLNELNLRPQGMEAYQAVFKAHPEDALPLQRASAVYLKHQEWENLLITYKIEARVASNPSERERLLLAIAQIQAEHLADIPAARQTLAQLEQPGPLAEQVASIYERTISLSEAIAEADELATALLAEGEGADAALAWLEAAQLEYDRLGGQPAQALDFARQALDADPDNEDAQHIVLELSSELDPEPSITEEPHAMTQSGSNDIDSSQSLKRSVSAFFDEAPAFDGD